MEVEEVVEVVEVVVVVEVVEVEVVEAVEVEVVVVVEVEVVEVEVEVEVVEVEVEVVEVVEAVEVVVVVVVEVVEVVVVVEVVEVVAVASHHLVGREENLEELAEAARVVVPQRARVAERLEHRRRLQNLLGQSDDVDVVAAGAQPRAPRQVAEHMLRRFGLAGAALAADDDRLVELVDDAQPVRAVGDRERVRRLGADRAAAVLFHRRVVVDAVDDAERVDGDEDRAGVRVHLLRLRLVPHAHVVQQRRLREERQRRVVGARPIVGTRRAERGHRHGLLAARDLDAHHAVGRRRREHLALDERRRRVADVARRRRAGQPHADAGNDDLLLLLGLEHGRRRRVRVHARRRLGRDGEGVARWHGERKFVRKEPR